MFSWKPLNSNKTILLPSDFLMAFFDHVPISRWTGTGSLMLMCPLGLEFSVIELFKKYEDKECIFGWFKVIFVFIFVLFNSSANNSFGLNKVVGQV